MHPRFSLLSLLLFPLTLLAEGGLWLETAAEKSFNKQWSAELSLGHRLVHDFSQAARWSGAAALQYKPSVRWKLAIGYQYMQDLKDEEGKINFTQKGKRNGYNVDAAFWRPRHRLSLEATYKWKIGKRWTLSLRERYQWTHNAEATTTEWKYRKADEQGAYAYQNEHFRELTSEPETKAASERHYLRSRLKLERSIKGCPLSPFATYELVNDLADRMDIVRHRFALGTDWRLGKQHSLSFAFLHQIGNSDNGNSAPLNVIDLGYKFKF